MEPSDVPALKKPVATERSLAGNQTAIVFMPAGMAEASATPSRPRKKASDSQPVAKPCRQFATDQTTTNSMKPSFRPRKSTT